MAILTKEDYLKFSKERLAELLVEKDRELASKPSLVPYTIVQERQPLCYEPGGICTNKFHDCINCPRTNYTGFNYYSTSWTGQETKNFPDKEDIKEMPDGNPRT